MQATLDEQIRDQLAHYLSGRLPLQEFGNWFAGATLNVHRLGNPSAEAMTYEIALCLAEYSNGDWTDDELRDLLRPLLAPGWRPQPQNLPQPRSA